MTFLEALRSRTLRPWWLFIVATFPVIVLVDYLAVAPVGHDVVLAFKLPYIYAAMVAILAVLALPLWAIFLQKRRGLILAWWCAALVFLVSLIGGEICGASVRHRAFVRLAERSSSLVDAIKRHEQEVGAPPQDLNTLVPKYLGSVPATGMMAYPQYLYEHGPETSSRYEGNPWVLRVNTPNGMMNWDEFLYFPLQNYPTTGYGGRIQRIRDWGYLHE